MLLLCLLPGCLPFAAAEQPDDRTLLSFYDDSVFFGDSRMQALRHYVYRTRDNDRTFMESTQIICNMGISLYNASCQALYKDSANFTYRGVEATLYDIAKWTDPARVFIMLGINDPVATRKEKAVKWVTRIITTLHEMLPETEVCFFSETPVTALYERGKGRSRYQKKLDEYNARLKETCEQNGARFIDIADVLKDENNYLKKEYCTDGKCHLSEEGISVWIQAMTDYARQQYELGLWEPKATGSKKTVK